MGKIFISYARADDEPFVKNEIKKCNFLISLLGVDTAGYLLLSQIQN